MSEPLETPILLRCYAKPDEGAIKHRAQSRTTLKSRERRAARAVMRPDTPISPAPQVAALSAKLNTLDAAIKNLGRPYGEWCFVFDTETTTDTRQALRFGVYAVYGIKRDLRKRLYRQGKLTTANARAVLDHEHERGLFYNPDVLDATEITTILMYADANRFKVWTRDDFVTDVLYHWVYRYQALCIGHNLPFDVSRLATRVVQAGGGRGHLTDAGTMTTDFYGGFSLKLCRCHGDEHCVYHPNVRIKMIASKKAFIAFVKVKEEARQKVGGQMSAGPRGGLRGAPVSSHDTGQAYTGKFLDTATLGLALLGPGDSSLKGMGKRFKADVIKYDSDEHGETLTHPYLDYAMHDIAATWALYRAERALYIAAPMWKIYSEASLGKSYWREMGVPPFMAAHPDFPAEVVGYAMTAYYGGRSECRCRLMPVEVIYTDFKSQYPTVNALLRLQDILLAKEVTTRDATEDVRAWLARGPDQLLADMRDPTNWPRLRVLVNITPQDDILPARAKYPMQRAPRDTATSLNIGVNYLTAGAMWYTLADVIASMLLTGKAPRVIEAREIVPSAAKVTTQPLTLFGDERYTIDLSTQDFFTEVINLRGEVKAEMTAARDARCHADADNLDGLQIALKLLANSTAYGSLMEVTADEPTAEKRPVTVYGLHSKQTYNVVMEWPGSYFAGPLGAFITAGGRLLLAMAEKLAADRGITYAICDTDSMAFARPDGMSRDDFGRHVHDIRAAFDALSPYRDKPPILEREDINDWQEQPEPLYCVAVSTKRYCLYNRLDDGGTRIRKFTHHGLGTWQLQVGGRDGFTLPAHMSPPCETSEMVKDDGSTEQVPDSYRLGGPLWSYALWYDFVQARETGVMSNGEPLMYDGRGVPAYPVIADWLDMPAFYRATLSTWELYERYQRYIPDARPFSFITVLPHLEQREIIMRLARIPTKSLRRKQHAYDGIVGKAFIAPFARKARDLRDIRLADEPSILVSGIVHKSMREMLDGYFRHGEAKTGDPCGMGYLPRRHVVANGYDFIGKETNRKAILHAEETAGIIDGINVDLDGATVYASERADENGDIWRAALQPINAKEIALMAGLKPREVQRIKSGVIRHPSPDTMAKINAAVAAYRVNHDSDEEE